MENTSILTNKNKWFYSTGCVGRDMAYTMVSMFLFTYVQYTVGLTASQFFVVTLIMILCRVWDAVNDPMMGTIITNTKSKFGKFRPWILIGAVTNAIVLVLMFSIRLSGWSFVAFFGVMYLLWGMTFTMNDVGYWSMLPALTKTKKERDVLTTLVAVFASIGAFAAGGLIPMFTTGNAVNAYRLISIIVAITFVVCQFSVFLNVKDESVEEKVEEKVTFKKMFKIITSNKQLMWMSLVVLFYSLGSAILNALGVNFFYFEFGYEGNKLFIFTVMYALGTIASQAVFPMLSKKYTRKTLINISMLMMILGYACFLLFGIIQMDLTIKFILLCVFSILIFAGQGVFYLTMLIMLTNTIEYGEWSTGTRNESIIFSIRPFMVKLASAFQQLVVYGVLAITGLYKISNEISEWEIKLGKNEVTKDEVVNAANSLIGNATQGQLIGLTVGMTIIPIVLFVITYFIIKKKYIIDEDMYDKMVKEINERKAN